MASKPETVFYQSIHRYLTDVYFEKMFNPYRSGTPDVWYSGNKSDLWIEYKFLQSIPVRADITVPLSALQTLWLSARHVEGRRVAVVCGCKDGGVILLDRQWEKPIRNLIFKSVIMKRKEIAEWIRDQVGIKHNESSQSSVYGSKIK